MADRADAVTTKNAKKRSASAPRQTTIVLSMGEKDLVEFVMATFV
jgi:hypothetical protein